MNNRYHVTAFYKFVGLEALESLQRSINTRAVQHGLGGTILLAPEGINGTIAGEGGEMADFLAWLKSDARFADIDCKHSRAADRPFLRMKVRLKREIVAMGVTDLDPGVERGSYVAPADWNAMIADPEVLLVDARNDYEIAIGTFEGAVNPNTVRFRDLPQWMEENLRPDQTPKLAMFCTGGIRCEKSTSLARKMGIQEVYHLKGGILKYLEDVDEADSKWRGECFVFDQRVSVTHGLGQGSYQLCHACRHPLGPEALMAETFIDGVQCHNCAGEKSPQQRQRYQERQRQIDLAKSRGGAHLG